MSAVTWTHGTFRLAQPLDEAAIGDLRQRALPRPAWDKLARAWRYGEEGPEVQALDFLAQAGLAKPDAAARTRLDTLRGQAGLPDARSRLDALHARLRPYQREGVDFILERRRVLLADAMGLGKTLQALAAVERADAYPCIVVCPAAVKSGWAREVVKWTPWRTAQVLHKGRDALRRTDVTVVNPELLPAHLGPLKARGARALVLDEAHFFKNPGSQRSRNAFDLSRGVPLRMALTGTPIKNRREDLVHQLRILDQLEPVLHIYRGLLPHWYKPGTAIAEQHAIHALERLDARTLHERLREVCMIRRTKADVAKDLPALERARIEVTPGHLAAYHARERAMLDWVRRWKDDEAPARRLEFRAHLTALRREAALAKLPSVKDWAEPLVESGERVIFFAYHKDVVARLAQALPGRCATITGDTPPMARRRILDHLDEVDFLVATMDSTGYGVDGIQLHASQVAFVELDWTPTKHEQCEGRLHRIGQTEHVNSWYFVAANTIDQVLMRVLERKWGDIQGVVEGQMEEEGFLEGLLRHYAAGGTDPLQA